MQQGVKTYTTLRAAIICIVVCLILLGVGVFSALPAYTVASMALLAMPTFLLIGGFVAGLWPMLACLVITLALLMFTGGTALMGFGALYLIPMCAAFVYCVHKQKAFWITAGMVLGALAASTVAIYAILQAMTGGKLYAEAANAVAEALSGADGVLYMFCQAGLTGLPAAMQETALVQLENGTYVFSDEARRELLLQVRSIVMQLLQGSLPSLLVSGSVINVLSGLGLGIHFGRRAAHRRAYKRGIAGETIDFPDLAMPPLHMWYIPRGWGIRIGVLASGYIIIQFAAHETLFMLGALMWQTFFVCYAIQGLAAMNDMQRKRGTGKFWRTALIVAAFLISFVQTALMIVGVFDQISNARGLRPQTLPRNKEE